MLFVLSGLIAACADGPSGPAAGPSFGWRSAGLILPDADNTGGLRRLVAIGNTLFAMDAYESGKAPASRPRQWRIWKGRVGSDKWSIVPMPAGEVPSEWAVVGGDLIVGTQYTGRVFRYSLNDGKWFTVRKAALPGGEDSLPNVWGVGDIGGRALVSISMNATASHQCFIQQEGEQDSLSPIPCMGPRRKTTFSSIGTSGQKVYGYQSEWGVARFSPGDSFWESLPSPRGRTDAKEWEFLSALSAVDGKIYVGYEKWGDGVFRWDEGKWTSMTPPDSLKRRETSKTVNVIAGYRGRLFQAGSEGSGIAMLTPRESGEVVWGDWRLVDSGWCEITGWCPWQTRAIIGVGDTLYAAAWNFIAKVPFADLDRMARPMYSK